MAKYLRHQKTGRLMEWTEALFLRHGVASLDASEPFLTVVEMSEKKAARISKNQKLKGETIHDLVPQCSTRVELIEVATRFGIGIDEEQLEQWSLTNLKNGVLEAYIAATPEEQRPKSAHVIDKDDDEEPEEEEEEEEEAGEAPEDIEDDLDRMKKVDLQRLCLDRGLLINPEGGGKPFTNAVLIAALRA